MDANSFVIEARNLSDADTPGKVYVREKISGTWGAWTVEAASQYVEIVGDTMVGDLAISKTSPTLVLNKTDVSSSSIFGLKSNIQHWAIALGAGAGDDFAIANYNDAGTFLGNVVTINRLSGATTFTGGEFNIKGNVPFGYGRLYIDDNGGAFNSGIVLKHATVNRWEMTVTADAAGDLAISKFNDAGAGSGTPISIARATGNVVVTTTTASTTKATGGLVVAGGLGIGGSIHADQMACAGATAGAFPGYFNTDVGIALNNNSGGFFALSRGASPCSTFNINLDGQNIAINRSGTTVGSISVTTTATAYNTSSDERLKKT